MTEVERILVVGGGIGGLSTSIALRRAGFDVDVVEKNPALGRLRRRHDPAGNALRVLHEIGLAEQCVAAGHPMFGDKTWLGDGETMHRRTRLAAARRRVCRPATASPARRCTASSRTPCSARAPTSARA